MLDSLLILLYSCSWLWTILSFWGYLGAFGCVHYSILFILIYPMLGNILYVPTPYTLGKHLLLYLDTCKSSIEMVLVWEDYMHQKHVACYLVINISRPKLNSSHLEKHTWIVMIFVYCFHKSKKIYVSQHLSFIGQLVLEQWGD